MADRILLVDGPDRGDVLQAEKAGILEIADLIACNKSDLPGSLKAMKSIQDGLSYSENPHQSFLYHHLQGMESKILFLG